MLLDGAASLHAATADSLIPLLSSVSLVPLIGSTKGRSVHSSIAVKSTSSLSLEELITSKGRLSRGSGLLDHVGGLIKSCVDTGSNLVDLIFSIEVPPNDIVSLDKGV